MYTLLYVDSTVCGFYNDMRLALDEMERSGYAVYLINTATGEVITNNFDWE